MNFLNFLTSSSSMFNFNLLSTNSSPQRQNRILVKPQKQQDDILMISQKKNGLNNDSLISQSIDSKVPEQNLQKILKGQEQLLINQYLELNIKYLSQQLETAKKTENQVQQNQIKSQISQDDKEDHQQNKSVLRKKIKKFNKCGHENKPHYAKGMCNNCYHKHGRTKKPWNCSHSKLYAAGMCQNCYINSYNRKKREQKHQDQQKDMKIDVEDNRNMEVAKKNEDDS